MDKEERTYVLKASEDAIFWNGYEFTMEPECRVYRDLEQVFPELKKLKKGDSVIRNYGYSDEQTVYVIP
jgi:hypothetical protein